MTPDQIAKMRANATHLIAERDAGRKVTKEGLEWAEWVLKMNFAQVPFDDDLPEHRLPGRERA
jgi:hypothetical protein